MQATIPNYNELSVSALNEVGNIGAGRAMTSLATLLEKRVEMSVPEVGIVPLSRFTQLTDGPEDATVGVYMPVSGDAPGHVAFLWSAYSACCLADQLLGRCPGTTRVLEEIECSALMEIGNILTSSYLMAISEMTDLKLIPSPPAIALDMSGSILSSIATEFASRNDEALTITTHIGKALGAIDGFFIYIPERGSLKALLEALQVDG